MNGEVSHSMGDHIRHNSVLKGPSKRKMYRTWFFCKYHNVPNIPTLRKHAQDWLSYGFMKILVYCLAHAHTHTMDYSRRKGSILSYKNKILKQMVQWTIHHILTSQYISTGRLDQCQTSLSIG